MMHSQKNIKLSVEGRSQGRTDGRTHDQTKSHFSHLNFYKRTN